MYTEKRCGNCKWCKPVKVESVDNGHWTYHMEYECQNEDSDGFGLEIIYDECCEEWEGKDGRY